MPKKFFILLSIVISVTFPILIQASLNTSFRDLFNPAGCIILTPNLRILSTLICLTITYVPSLLLLIKANSSKWLYIAHAICCFLWSSFVAMICFSISAGSSRQRVRAQIDVSGMNLVDYQNLVDGISNTSLDGNILTIELSEEAFYRWYYRTHEPTISALSNTLLES